MQNEDLSKKEYCDKKWEILKPHVQSNIVEKIQELQTNLDNSHIPEVSYIAS